MGAGPPAQDPPKPAAPGHTCPDLCQATLLTGNAGASSEAKAPVIKRTNVCNERAYCVPGCPHPASPASTLFGKTCPSCLLGQIPGQAAQPAGETWRAGKNSPSCAPLERSNTASGPARQHLAPLGGSPGASGKPREAELPGGCVPATPPPSLFPAPGVGGPRSVGKRLPLASA